MRHRSAKREAVYRDTRRPLVARLLDERPVCERCWQARSVDVHEIKTRARGGSITDEANLACLCRPCHEFVTRNPAQAHREGFMRHSWETP